MNSPEMRSEVEEGGTTGLSVFERLRVWFISTIGYWAIRLICSSLRWEIEGWENYEAVGAAKKRVIYAFWHGRIFMATYFWRRRGIVVMTSQNKDGEYIARVIQRFRYGAARGSSSRGSRRALVEMIHFLRRGQDVAFTIDGPRGPRYVAKPGAAYLAWKTGHAVLPFSISLRKKWVLHSWDHFQIPKPFTRCLVLIGAPIYVQPNATEEEIDRTQQEIQHSLDRLRDDGDTRWGGQEDR